MDSVSAAPTVEKKEEIKKSKVSRFPLMETIYPRINDDLPFTFHHSYYNKFALKYGTPNPNNVATAALGIPRWGAGSAAMAACERGWYSKTGCCQNIISDTGTNTRIAYYIPHVGPMSIRKKIAYINELEKLFPRRLKVLGVNEGQIVRHPLGFMDGEEQRIVLGASGGITTEPRAFTGVAKKYIIVHAKVMSSRDRLLFLQFLRPLYQTIPLSLFTSPHYLKASHFNSEYYQPRLYQRLAKWFPKLTPHELMFLSFTIHGCDTNSTYFPYYNVNHGFNIKYNLTSYDSILYLTGQVGKSNRWPVIPNTTIEDIVTGKIGFNDIDKFVRSSDPNVCQRLLKALFCTNTKESFKLAIQVIGLAYDNKNLIKNV